MDSLKLRFSTDRWASVAKPLFPWATTLDKILRLQKLESLNGTLVNLFSDYAGAHKGSAYWVSSYLYMDVFASQEWDVRRQLIRDRFLPEGRRLSFKGLNDRYKRDALVPFLEAANRISGLCLSLAVKKTMQSLCSDKEMTDQFTSLGILTHRWSHQQMDRLFQVAHTVGFLIGGLSLPKQNFFWYSDDDDLFANAKATLDMNRMVSVFTQHYVRHELGRMGLGTAQMADPGDRLEEDHIAVPDLAAGAIAEHLTIVSQQAGGRLPTGGVAFVYEADHTPKTDVILSWLGDSNHRLQKLLILFEPADSGRYSVSRVDL